MKADEPSSPRPTDAADPFRSGRFRGEVDPAIRAFTRSLHFDRRLARHDLVASLAHVRMLTEREIVSRQDGMAILEGLADMLREVEAGELPVEGHEEDVHAWIERTLRERIGEPAGWLHTARSRNDQTAAALRLYVRERLRRMAGGVVTLVEAWLEDAERHQESVMPGYTHLQRGQPVTLAHHLLAHAWALLDDAGRLRRGHDSAGISPLGAGALATTSHPVNPERTAELLGFEGTFRNSIHAVSDRAYVAEAAFACAMIMVTLSRWAEEVVLWTSSEFGFAVLGDDVAQGSSLMPQKRNPEAAELVRGKCGRVLGDLTSILTMLKGLPLAYDSDMQEDKEAVFDALDTADDCLGAAAVVARSMSYRKDRLREALRGGFVTATALADHLVRRGIDFREAHRQAGLAVARAEELGRELWELSPEEIRSCCRDAGAEAAGGDGGGAETGAETRDDVDAADLVESLDPDRAVRAQDVPGGPAPVRVAEQLREARRETEDLRSWAAGLEEPPIYRAFREGALLAEDLS